MVDYLEFVSYAFVREVASESFEMRNEYVEYILYKRSMIFHSVCDFSVPIW